MNRPRRGLQAIPLWVQLAALGAVGVVAMHALHLVLGARLAGRALAAEQERLGRRIALLVAQQAVDPLLVGDLVTVHELLSSAASEGDGSIVYCFIERGGRVVAFGAQPGVEPPPAGIRPAANLGPLVVRQGGARILDLAEPILDGELGVVRLGLDMAPLQATRHTLAIQLGLLALGVAAAGLVAAFLAGRAIARPIAAMAIAADSFDPGAPDPPPRIAPGANREIAALTERFNRMMLRLQGAHAEQARARQKSVETERLVALGELVAGVAHEVNNPLAGLKNCVNRLERPDLPDGKRREYLALMSEGLGRIGDVVRRLLDFGRPAPPRLEAVSALRLAEESAALVQPLLANRRARARLLGFEDGGAAWADRRLCEQALVNLLINAAWVTPEGGEVRLCLRRRPRQLGLAVEDDGPGIPPEIRDRILDPFFSTKPEGEGTGLGLSVTRTIVDAHEGELAFEFPSTGGTVATIWLPQASGMPGDAG